MRIASIAIDNFKGVRHGRVELARPASGQALAAHSAPRIVARHAARGNRGRHHLTPTRVRRTMRTSARARAPACGKERAQTTAAPLPATQHTPK